MGDFFFKRATRVFVSETKKDVLLEIGVDEIRNAKEYIALTLNLISMVGTCKVFIIRIGFRSKLWRH